MFCTEKLKLYTGAKIVTLYDPMPIVEAVCVIGERIHAIGSLEDMERYAALCGEYEKIDLGGGVLYPAQPLSDTCREFDQVGASRCGGYMLVLIQ